MYRIEGAGTDQLTIRHIPWLPWIVGLLFVVGGAAIALFVTTLVRLRCDRGAGTCALEQSTLVATRTTSWPVKELTGAELQTVSDDSGVSYRIVVRRRHGVERFTSFSSGTARQEREAVVSRIQAFVANPDEASLEVAQDERLPVLAVAGGFMLFGLLPWIVQGMSVCTLDGVRQRLVVEQRALPGRGRREEPLSELVRAEVFSGDNPGTASTCRIALALRSGETIAFPRYRYPGRAQAAAAAEAINAFLERGGNGFAGYPRL